MADYEIGYGKPPRDSQFKEGCSGNPKGRPKGHRNFKTALQNILDQAVTVRDGDLVRTVPSRDAALIQLVTKAFRGDQRALDRLLVLAERYDLEDTADQSERELAKEDQEIIERFVDRRNCEAKAQKADNQNTDNQDETP